MILIRLYRRWQSGPSAASRGPLALLAHQARFELLASFRNPRARFFTFFFPVLLLVIFAGLFGHGTTTVDGVKVHTARFFVPGDHLDVDRDRRLRRAGGEHLERP